MKKGIILLTIPNFKTAGSQYVVLSLYNQYKKSGYRTFILISDLNPAFHSSVDEEDRLVIPMAGYLNLLDGLKYCSKFIKLIKTLNINVVHSWDYKSEIWESLACRLAGIPYVFTKKNNAWSKKWWLKSLSSTHVAYDHPEMSNRFFNDRLLKNKITFIPHGINTQLFSPSSKVSKPTYTIGCIGNIGVNKNQLIILKALAECNSNINCVFYGNKDASYFSSLSSYVTSNNLDSRVTFYDYVSNSELPQVIQNLDILILASFNEGLPVTLLESIACGTYCLASDSGGGTKYILDICKTGALFDPTDFQQLAQLIQDYYRHTEEKEEIAKQAIANLRLNFSAEKEASAYLKLFNKLLN